MRAWTIVGFLRLLIWLAPWFAVPAIAGVQSDRNLPSGPPHPPPPFAPPAPPAPPPPSRIHVPAELLADEGRGVAGNVELKIAIAGNGAITACSVSRGVSPALDQASCAFLRKRVWPIEPSAPVRSAPVERSVVVIWRTPPKTPSATTFGGAAPIDIPWMTYYDYPAAAMKANEQGAVVVQFAISKTGRVTACEVIESSGSASLDESSCAIVLARGRFLASLDGEGRPQTATGKLRMRWQITE